MPKRLPARWQPETIREFRAAARQRFQDALALAGSGRRTGAVYLWGYSAEIILKAAYFRLRGLAEADVITWVGHIQPAIERGRNLFGIAWPRPGQGHNVRAWADLQIAERAATPGAAYLHAFGRDVQRSGQAIGQLWSEALRYHKNLAYIYEMNQVHEAAEWLLVHADAL
jgi:hypothetical protein